MDSPEENGRRERRVRRMLKTFYGNPDGKMEGDDDPLSVDSASFDIDQYFNQVMRGTDLAGLQSILEKFEQGSILFSLTFISPPTSS